MDKVPTGTGARDADDHDRRAPSLPGALTALAQAPLGIAIFDREMRYLAASSRFLTDQGLPGDTPLVGRLHYDVFPDIPQRWRDIHRQVIDEGVELRHDADRFERADGRVEFIRWSISPWREEGGTIGGLVLYTEVATPSVEARLRLEAAEARYRAVFDLAAMGVALVSPEGQLTEVNDRFCAIVRRPRESLLNLRFQDITHPDDIEPDIAGVKALLAGEIDRFSLEKRYFTPDAQTIWVNLTVSLVRKADGAPDHFVSIIEDIGLRKQAEVLQQRYQDQLRLLINELNHRVKNTLATVQAMAAQTMRRASDPAVAYEAFEARLIGLAEVHEVLTRERWHGASLLEVAERAFRPFQGPLSNRVRIDGPDARLQPGAALTMALLLHELATNAVKYGSLSVEAGRVDLSWNLDDDLLHLRMDWVESGGPPVVPPTRKGFGTRLLERGMRGELRGSTVTTYEPAGLRCRMEALLTPPGAAPEFPEL